MNDSVPMAGFLRVVYFFALAGVLVTLILTGVTRIYEKPEDDSDRPSPVAFFTGGGREDDSEESSDQADYRRNTGAIFSLIGAAAMTFGILGLRLPANAARTGLVAGGLAVFFTGMTYGLRGADDWLVPIWAAIAFAGLAVSGPFLHNGLDALTGRLDSLTRRWWPRPSA